MLNNILLLFGIAAVLSEVFMLYLWTDAKWRYRKEKPPQYYPKTMVIVPCKETYEKFRENIQAICSQDYKNYEIVFVTDSVEDPAYNELKEILCNNPKTRLETAGYTVGCSGKISALIKGIRSAGDVDVYVFADSDIKPDKDWLHNLVSYLKDDEIGATTGYRWFFPCDLKSLLISTWNLVGMIPFYYHSFNYAWGGSTAIRKKLFDELDIENKWIKGFSDDLILTNTLKNAGYKIKFVPKCIVESYYNNDIKKFIKWGTRQYVWAKWYFPLTWRVSFVRMIGVKFLVFLGIVLIITGFTLPGLLMISTILIEIIIGWQGFTTVKKTMCYPKGRHDSALAYALAMPVAFFIIAYNVLSSSFKKEVEWAGRKYTKSDLLSSSNHGSKR